MPTAPTALITGASSGIGAATARLFAAHGYRVALAARRADRLQELADEIRATGGEAEPFPTDVGVWEQVQTTVEGTIERFGQIDLLFNNAGFGRIDWLERLDPGQGIQDQLQVNLLGLIWMARAVLPHMIERRQGQIINMSSMAGRIATPTYSVYAASKFGVRGFSDALRREVGIYGIKVSVLYPGGVATEFGERAQVRRRTGITTPAFLRLSAEQVAQGALSLARRPRRSLILPWFMRFAVAFEALFPGIFDRLVEGGFTRRER